MKKIVVLMLLVLSFSTTAFTNALLIPMDAESQTNHLKAYGLTYWAIDSPRSFKAEWLLNYRGGSFVIYEDAQTRQQALLRGVTVIPVSEGELAAIHAEIETQNMDRVPLERAPKVAIYTPPSSDPWDDAVTLALNYAEIPYETIWDPEVLDGRILQYDWLHLHHEDFTGQFGKFYRTFRTASWYLEKVREFESAARRAGFTKVQQHKAAVATAIRDFVEQGGFMFAMCAATDTIDIALSAKSTDIVAREIDGDDVSPDYQSQLDFSETLAFRDFELIPNPLIYEYSNIDTSPSPTTNGARYQSEFFDLFEFSAKFDPVPTILTQSHSSRVDDFWGQTTAFRKDMLKSNVIILADFPGTGVAKYIHGVVGEGTFTFLGGHDPEDAQHLVGEGDTDLSQHPNSPGYRLILNNVLFPAAKKKPRKT